MSQRLGGRLVSCANSAQVAPIVTADVAPIAHGGRTPKPLTRQTKGL